MNSPPVGRPRHISDLALGTSFYFPAVLAAPIAAETGWSLGWVVGGVSIGMVVAGLIAPHVGAIIDRRGGRPVLAASSLLYAVGRDIRIFRGANAAASLKLDQLAGPDFHGAGRPHAAPSRGPLAVSEFMHQLGGRAVAPHRRHRVVDQALYEHATTPSAAFHANRSRRLIKMCEDFGHHPVCAFSQDRRGARRRPAGVRHLHAEARGAAKARCPCRQFSVCGVALACLLTCLLSPIAADFVRCNKSSAMWL